MTARRRFRWWLLELVELAIASYAIASEQIIVLLIAGPIAAASWYLVEGPRGIALPRWVVNVGAIGAIAWSALDFASGEGIARTMELLGRFVTILLVLRQLQQRTVREDAQQLVLALVLVLASSLQSVRLLFGALVVVWAFGALYTVMLFRLYAGAEQARVRRRREAPDDATLIPPLAMVFGPADASSLRRLAIATGFGTIFVSLVVFVVFPRELFYQGQSGRGGAARTTGFAPEVDLVTGARISESRREVFTVRWEDAQGASVEFSEPLLLRGAVLDVYNPELDRWISSRNRQLRSIEPQRADEMVPLGIAPIDDRIQTYTMRVTMRSLASEVIFTPWLPIAISLPERRIVQIDPRTGVLRDTGNDRLGRLWRYSVRVQPFATEAAQASIAGTPARQRRRLIPQEIRSIALEALEEMNVSFDPRPDEDDWRRDRRVARALGSWLADPARFRYSTDLSAFSRRPGEDSVVAFLARERFGHCEFFASALVTMCWALDIDARMVTGFVAMEYDENSEHYVVRESNAHAWAEVRVGQQAWMTVDPTPPSELEAIQARNRSWIDQFRWVYDRVDFLWNSRFVSFDSRSQATLADRLQRSVRDRGSRWLESTRRGVEQVRSLLDPSTLGPIGLGIAAAVAVGAIVATAIVLRRRQRTRRLATIGGFDASTARRLSVQLGFWIDAVDAVAGSVPREAWETPGAWAARASAVHPRIADPLARLVDRLYRVRFGDARLDATELASARRDVMLLRARLRRVDEDRRAVEEEAA